MDVPVPSSDGEFTWDPGHDSDIFMVAFQVEKRGFRIDAQRLTMHCEFLRNMLVHSDGKLGSNDEGSTNRPIKVDGCTASAFANFCSWLNHDSWAPLQIDHQQQLIDILHICHMWEIAPGVEFASNALLTFNLHPAHRVYLAARYGLQSWIRDAVSALLKQPLNSFSQTDLDHMGFLVYSMIATGKEAIATERKRLANHPPFPKDFDEGPFCAADRHVTCKKVWTEKWFYIVVRQVHHPFEPIPLSMVPEVLREIDHKGMNIECKDFILDWLCTSCDQVRKEQRLTNDIIQNVIDSLF